MPLLFLAGTVCKFYFCILSVPWLFIGTSCRLKVLQGRKRKDTKFLTALAKGFWCIKHLLHQQGHGQENHTMWDTCGELLYFYMLVRLKQFPACAKGHSWKPGIYTHGSGSQLSNLQKQTWERSFKTTSKPCRQTWRIFKAIHMNQFISGLCWAYLTWATVLNHSAGWVEMCPDGAAGWGFIIAAAFQGGLLAPAHKPPTDHFIWLYVYAYVYICAYRLQQAFGKRYLMNIYHIFKLQFQLVLKILRMKQRVLVGSLITSVSLEV